VAAHLYATGEKSLLFYGIFFDKKAIEEYFSKKGDSWWNL
jgi:hypothetical protein